MCFIGNYDNNYIIFHLYSVNTLYYTDIFSNVELSLYPSHVLKTQLDLFLLNFI